MSRTSRKILAVLLTVLMLVSSVSIAASAVISVASPSAQTVYFYVPECIYLAASGNASTTLTSMQYYLNSYSSSTATSLAATEASGRVYFYCPGATRGTLTYTVSTGMSITLASGTASSSNTFNQTFTGSAFNQDGVITWVYTYVDTNGVTRSVTSYTYIYKPNAVPTGFAHETQSDGSKGDCYLSYACMIWGANASNTASYGPSSAFYIYGSGLFTAGNTKPTTAGYLNAGWYPQYFAWQDGGSGRNITTSSPMAYYYVDGSRFTNFSQIPHIRFGICCSDDENTTTSDFNIRFQTSGGSDIQVFVNSASYIDNETVICNYAGGGKYGLMRPSYAMSNIGVGSSGAYRLYVNTKGSGKSGHSDSRGTGLVNFTVYNTNKSALRSAYLNQLKASFSQQANRYTTASWNTYAEAMRKAAVTLGDPYISYATVTGAISTLSSATAGLTLQNYTANVRHVALVPSGESYIVKAIDTASAVTESVTYNAYNTLTLKANSYEGYTFYGYKANQSDTVGSTAYSSAFAGITAGGNGQVIKSSAATLNYTYYYIINSYDLSYQVDGEAYRTDTYLYHQAIALPDMTKTGYTFSGWSWSTGAAPTVMPASDVNATGGYTINQYDVNYYVNGSDYATDTYDYNAPVTMRPDISQVGYTFSGWSPVLTAMPAEDVDVSASLTENEYTVKYDANVGAGTVIGEMMDQSCYYDDPYNISYCDFIREFYVFVGWNTEADGSGTAYGVGREFSKLTAVDDEVITLYAQWELDPDYNEIIYYVDGVEYDRIVVRKGDVVDAHSEPAKFGYTFSGWIGEPEIMGEQGVTVTGFFTANKHNIYYYVDRELYLTVPASYSDEISLIADISKDGFTFSGWSDLPATMPDSDLIVTGEYTVNKYNIVYMVDGAEYERFDGVDFGTALTAIDDPEKTGHTFSGWSEIPATLPSHDITISGTFTINSYDVIYTVDGTPYAKDSYLYNAPIVKRADAVKTGYTFSGWTWSENTVNMPANNISVTGIFTANSYQIRFNSNGGFGAMNAQPFDYDTSFTLNANKYTRNYYTFAAWNTAADGSGETYLDAQSVINICDPDQTTITLYAQWDISGEDYTITDTAPTGYLMIHTEQGLDAIIKDNLDRAFILMDDIDLSDYNWEPIGTAAAPFTGAIIGNGHVIYGLSSTAASASFFAYTDGATIKDIVLADVNINATGTNSYAGPLVAQAKNTTIKNCVIASGTVRADSTDTVCYAGGIVGKLDGGAIGNSYNAAKVISSGFAGGVAGMAVNGASISNAYNAGEIVGNVAGGLIGTADTVTVSKCHNVGALSANTVGAALGLSADSVLRYVYYSDISVSSAIGNGTATLAKTEVLTSQQMQAKASFEGFDFINNWSISDKGYPVLEAIEEVHPNAAEVNYADKFANKPADDDDSDDPSTENMSFWRRLAKFFSDIFAMIAAFFGGSK